MAAYSPNVEDEVKEDEMEGGSIPFPPPPDTLSPPPSLKRVDVTLYEPNAAFVLENLLSLEECQFYIDEAERHGIPSLDYSRGYKKEYRNNDRLCFRSPELSSLLWSRVSSLFDRLVVTPQNKLLYGPTYNMEGEWAPRGLNVYFRLCRYHPGGHFAPHYDGHYLVDSHNRSFFTFMIYLNGGYEGGTTNWVSEDQMLFCDPDTGIFRAEDRYVIGRITPIAGSALVFSHHLLHEGATLRSGVKYILRTEVMYTKQSERTLHPDEERALKYLEEAEEAEYNKEASRAAELYRKALKLWPPLEETLK